MKNDLESIAVFVRVVREGSFSAAARELSFSPSAISKRIARLEEGLGVSLLSRTTRKVALTEAGQAFFETCSRGLSAIEEAEETVSRFGREPHGLLRVKVPQAFGRLRIAPSIPDFIARYPRVQVDLLFGPLPGPFMDERIDVLVASAPPPNVNLSVKTLTPLERVTCAAPSYIARHGMPRELTDLARHNCLIFTASDSIENEWVLHDEHGVRHVKVAGNFRTNDAEAIYSAARAGVGVAHMPRFIVDPALASRELVSIFSDRGGGSGAAMRVYYALPKNRLPKVEVFVDFLVRLFASAQQGPAASGAP